MLGNQYSSYNVVVAKMSVPSGPEGGGVTSSVGAHPGTSKERINTETMIPKSNFLFTTLSSFIYYRYEFIQISLIFNAIIFISPPFSSIFSIILTCGYFSSVLFSSVTPAGVKQGLHHWKEELMRKKQRGRSQG